MIASTIPLSPGLLVLVVIGAIVGVILLTVGGSRRD
jgi:hypothetical protein